jgi:hypothetical protein
MVSGSCTVGDHRILKVKRYVEHVIVWNSARTVVLQDAGLKSAVYAYLHRFPPDRVQGKSSRVEQIVNAPGGIIRAHHRYP